MSTEAEIRALKRELAGRGKRDPKVADEIVRELALRGEKLEMGTGVEKRSKPKKSGE